MDQLLLSLERMMNEFVVEQSPFLTWNTLNHSQVRWNTIETEWSNSHQDPKRQVNRPAPDYKIKLWDVQFDL